MASEYLAHQLEGLYNEWARANHSRAIWRLNYLFYDLGLFWVRRLNRTHIHNIYQISPYLLYYFCNMTTAELSKRQQIVRTVVGSQELEGAPMDVRMRQALEAFAQGKLSIDDLLALARQIAESGVLAAPIDGLYSLRSHKWSLHRPRHRSHA